jgi:hypothetical protein
MKRRDYVTAVVLGTIGIFAIIWLQGQQQNNDHKTFCQDWYNQLQSKAAGLQARANSIGGTLDLSGNLRSDMMQYNMETQRYNDQCT